MYDIVIVGAGGFGREVYSWTKDSFFKDQYRIKGFLDDNNKALNSYNLDIGVIGNIDEYMPEKQDRFVIGIGDVKIKKQLIDKLIVKGSKFINLIHPTAVIADTAMIGKGNIIAPFVLISNCAKIDDFVIFNVYSSCGHDAKVGKYSTLSPYASATGFVVLEDEVFLGTHSTVIPGKIIGYKSKVSANSVVMRDVPPNKMVFGVPGKAI
jgi:sugar O-acyltransferase (sialic acid O-acetyltransferase NeuD family)